MEHKTESFNYTYSAREQEEIRNIRKKYVVPEEDKMAQLRKLDQSASQKAQAWSIAVGVIGALVMGAGMSIIMTSPSGFTGALAYIVGLPVGLAGMALAALALPVYNRILKKERERIAPEIIRLSDELMK